MSVKEPEKIEISDKDVLKCNTYQDGVYIHLNDCDELILTMIDIRAIAKAVGLETL